LDKINLLACYGYKIVFNNISGHIKFTGAKSFSINFDNGYDPQDNASILYPSLGYLLGFRQDIYYSVSNPDYIDDNCSCADDEKYAIYSECNLDVAGDTYLFLKINNYGVIHNDFEDVEITVKNDMINDMKKYPDNLPEQTATIIKKRQGDRNLLAKIILGANKGLMVFDNGSNYLTKSYTFRQQVDIDHLDIEIIDPRGYTINMECVDFSMTLEIGSIYDAGLYKDNNDNMFDNILSGLPNLPMISKLDKPSDKLSDKLSDKPNFNNIFADNVAPVIYEMNNDNIVAKPEKKKKSKYKFKY
jgi:hypothetical protein